MVKSRYIGDGHPTFNRNPYNGYINPYYWVDDHPLLYGNNGSLDPGTYGKCKMYPLGKIFIRKNISNLSIWRHFFYILNSPTERKNSPASLIDLPGQSSIPKYPDPSKVPILRTRTPAIQVPTPPLEGPRILRDI